MNLIAILKTSYLIYIVKTISSLIFYSFFILFYSFFIKKGLLNAIELAKVGNSKTLL